MGATTAGGMTASKRPPRNGASGGSSHSRIGLSRLSVPRRVAATVPMKLSAALVGIRPIGPMPEPWRSAHGPQPAVQVQHQLEYARLLHNLTPERAKLAAQRLGEPSGLLIKRRRLAVDLHDVRLLRHTPV